MALAPVAAHGVDADLRAQRPIAGGTFINIWRGARVENVLKLKVSDLKYNKRLPLQLLGESGFKEMSKCSISAASGWSSVQTAELLTHHTFYL